MKTRIIHTKIHFEDGWFNTLSIEYKYLFIYLFTNAHIGQTGAYELPKRVALIETGADEKRWMEACTSFQKADKVRFSGDWIYLVNAGKYANYSGGKNAIAFNREYEAIPKQIRDTLSIQYLYPMDTTINHKSEIINQKSETINGEDQRKSIERMREELSSKLSLKKRT